MFFILSKLFGFFVLPSNALIALALLGLVLLPTRFAGAGRRLLAVSVILLAIFGLSPFGNALILPLEDRFPRWDLAQAPPEGIIVLGGAIGPEISATRSEVSLNEAAERMTIMAELAKRLPAVPIVFSGGTGTLIRESPPESEFAVKLFESFGIARHRLRLESESRSTAENAVLTAALVKPKPGERWLLVTSAYHMPRAVGVFRGAGFTVEAYPVDFRTRGPGDVLTPFNSLAAGLQRSDTAIREWVGLVAYRLSGQSSELFPAP